MGKHLTDVTIGPLALVTALIHNLPAFLNGLVCIAALAWYGVRFYDRFVKGDPSSDEDY